MSMVTGNASGNRKRTAVDGLNGFGTADTMSSALGAVICVTAVTLDRLTGMPVGLVVSLLAIITIHESGSDPVGVTHTVIIVLPDGGIECAVDVVSMLNGAVEQPYIPWI